MRRCSELQNELRSVSVPEIQLTQPRPRTNRQKFSVVLVSEGTIPTERSQLVGEVGANFCG
jgi:hypothetical protein